MNTKNKMFRDVFKYALYNKGALLFCWVYICSNSFKLYADENHSCTSRNIKTKRGLHYLYAFKWPFQYISHFMRKPTIWSKFSICTFLFKNCFHVLRVYQTLIMWLRSLSAILPLFWRHDITNFLTFAAKTCEILFWRHEIHNIFPRNRTNALQN